MKKKWILLLAVTVMAGLFSGCTVDTKNSDNSSEDTEKAAIISDGANDEYDFAMEIGGQEISSEPILYTDYSLMTESNENDMFLKASVEWYFPMTFVGDNIKYVTFSTTEQIKLAGDYADCIVDSAEVEGYENIECDKTVRAFYMVKLDYNKLKDKNYKIQAERFCQRGIFADEWEEIFGYEYDYEKKEDTYKGFEGPIVEVICEYEDGSIQEKRIVAQTVGLNGQGEMVEDMSLVSDVGLAISEDSLGNVLLARPNDGGDKDTVYYGDTVVAEVSSQVDSAESGPSEIEVEKRDVQINLSSEEFKNVENEGDYAYSYNMCRKFVGLKVGEVMRDEWDYGDTSSWVEYKILDVVSYK